MRPTLFTAPALAFGMLVTDALARDIVGSPGADMLRGTPWTCTGFVPVF